MKVFWIEDFFCGRILVTNSVSLMVLGLFRLFYFYWVLLLHSFWILSQFLLSCSIYKYRVVHSIALLSFYLLRIWSNIPFYFWYWWLHLLSFTLWSILWFINLTGCYLFFNITDICSYHNYFLPFVSLGLFCSVSSFLNQKLRFLI